MNEQIEHHRAKDNKTVDSLFHLVDKFVQAHINNAKEAKVPQHWSDNGYQEQKSQKDSQIQNDNIRLREENATLKERASIVNSLREEISMLKERIQFKDEKIESVKE